MRLLKLLLFIALLLAPGGCSALPATLPLPTPAIAAEAIPTQSPAGAVPSVVIPTIPTPIVVIPTGSPVIDSQPAATASATVTTVLTETPSPTATPLVPTAAPTPPPHLLAGVTIDGLSRRGYPGGTVEVLQTLETTATYTRYYIAYPSD